MSIIIIIKSQVFFSFSVLSKVSLKKSVCFLQCAKSSAKTFMADWPAVRPRLNHLRSGSQHNRSSVSAKSKRLKWSASKINMSLVCLNSQRTVVPETLWTKETTLTKWNDSLSVLSFLVVCPFCFLCWMEWWWVGQWRTRFHCCSVSVWCWSYLQGLLWARENGLSAK